MASKQKVPFYSFDHMHKAIREDALKAMEQVFDRLDRSWIAQENWDIMHSAERKRLEEARAQLQTN